MMIAEEYLSRSRLYRRLRDGPHGDLAERYAARLVEVGLACQGTRRSLGLVGGLLSWIASSRSVLAELDECMLERYLRNRARKRPILPGDRLALKRFLSVLRDTCGIHSPSAPCWAGIAKGRTSRKSFRRFPPISATPTFETPIGTSRHART